MACWCPGISEVVVQLPELATSGTLDGATGYIYPTQEADDVTTEQAEQYGPTPTSQGVLGYRNLTPAEIELINEIKRLERKVAAKWVEVEAGIPGTDPDDPSQTVFPDTRWLNLARDQLQHGFSDLIRSVAKPVDPYDAGGGGTV